MSRRAGGVQERDCNLSFKQLWLKPELCDALIRVQDEEFPVHKIVLSGCSQYFRARFTRNSPPQGLVYKLDYGSPAIVKLIIEFAYTGSVEVTECNARDLHVASQYFGIPSLEEICCTSMEQQLCAENCIEMWQFSGFRHSKLHRSAYLFIVSHFREVCASPYFLELSVEELSEIIADDRLSVKEESTVLEAVQRWMGHLAQERSRHIAHLLPKVRLGLMTRDYFTNNVKNNSLMMQNIELADTIRMAETLIGERKSFPNGINHPLARPRLPARILLATGGCVDSGISDTIDAFDSRTNSWVTVAKNQAAHLIHHGSAFLGGSLYCVGGSNGNDVCKDVHRFDLETRTWHKVAPMSMCRCYVSVTVLNGCIFAIGGFDGKVRLSAVECYDPEGNQWVEINPMHEKRSDAGCTAMGAKVYVCGGYNGSQFLDSAECYNPDTDQWTVISPMSTKRSGLGVITYEDYIYAVGGFNGIHRVKTVEAYNPWTESWYDVSPMRIPRSNFGIQVVEDCIYVIGGFNDSSYLSNIEFYSQAARVWLTATDMKVPRGSLGCCVVYGLSNMADYATPRDGLPLSSLDSNA